MLNDLPVFYFLSVGAVSLFFFVGWVSWAAKRLEERRELYRVELLKKLADQGEGARNVIELLREEADLKLRQRRGGLLLGGMISAAVGLGVIILLLALDPAPGVWASGTIPLLIGTVLCLFAAFGMRPRQPAPPPGQEGASQG
jgi:hypothetical protein